ncbi:unnamed protein product [Tilletia controversa]|uniref:Ras-GEF domain-containing protein n=3 Tax=Tilletia TaxID=13289 RepID=A0A8X7MZC0_9BASI|nr:hypothetical protein CF336_g148 [Tilletia laevis]KAE8205995.1 hypothetical protein CF328_g172 [Tilletia controversa]KAE8264900.1 hypothetical protein A4X03_0g621 [Tilletia caries]KAE8208657.1 hypothetical protein CF335_g250 [Tilletia laevis]KAE8254342.1 hypothetical protein A4X06_0g944 [Tilletia controversa]
MLRRGNKQRKDSEPMPITGAAQQQLQQQHQQQQQQQQHGFNAAGASDSRRPTSPYSQNPAMTGASASLSFLPQHQHHQSQSSGRGPGPNAYHQQQQQEGAYAYSQQGGIPQRPLPALSQQQASHLYQQPKPPASAYSRTNSSLDSYSFASSNTQNSQGFQQPPPPPPVSPIPGSGPSSSMGRSQSALNFFISKAKGTFSSSSSTSAAAASAAGQNSQNSLMSPLASNQGMISSTSLSSLISHPENGAGTSNQSGRYPSNARSPAQSSIGGIAGINLVEEPVSSPTKRNFFGMNRDRKASNASLSKMAAGAAGASGYSQPGRSGTPGPGPRSGTPGPGNNTSPSLPYGSFSKSQSDLLSMSSGAGNNARPDLAGSPGRKLSFDNRANRQGTAPSPLTQPSQLPPFPGGQGEDGSTPPGSSSRYLRSPTSSTGQSAFSRSADDLSQLSSAGGGQHHAHFHALGSGAAKAHYQHQLGQLPPPPPIPHDQMGSGGPGSAGSSSQSPTLKGARQRGFGIGVASPVLKGERKFTGGGGSNGTGGGISNDSMMSSAMSPLPGPMLDNGGGGIPRSMPSVAGGTQPRQREFSAPQPAFVHPSTSTPPQGFAAFGHGRSESIPLSASSTTSGGFAGATPASPLGQGAVASSSAGGGGITGLFHAAVGVASGGRAGLGGIVGSGSGAGGSNAGTGSVSASQSVDSNLLLSPGPDAKHARRPSKLLFGNLAGGGGGTSKQPDSAGGGGARGGYRPTSGDDAARRAAAAGTLVPSSSVPPPPLPAGTTFQGFLLRNANISLSLQQLSEGSGGTPGLIEGGAFGSSSSSKSREKEKDISRGWKPYRVVLTNDGKMVFFKPPASMADEVRAAFPTTLVRSPTGTLAGPAGGGAGLGFGQLPITLDADVLKKAGLSSQSLVQSMGTGGNVPPQQQHHNNGRPGTARLDGSDRSVPTLGGFAMTASGSAGAGPGPGPSSAGIEDTSRSPPEWHQSDKHHELVLSNEEKAPARWGQRIVRGSVDALAHELVFATQLIVAESPAADARLPGNGSGADGGGGGGVGRLLGLGVTAPSPRPQVSMSANERDRETTAFVCAMLLNLLRFGHPVLALAQAINKWAVVALTSKDRSNLPARIRERLATKADQAGAFHDEVRGRVVLFLEVVQIDDALVANSAVREVLEKLATLASTSEKPFQLSLATLSDQQSVVLTDWVNRLAEKGPSSPQRRAELTALVQTRFSGQVLLGLSQFEVAQQISLFHRDRLRYLVTPRLTLSKLTVTGEAHATQQQARALFSFDSLMPHYLTRLVLDQLLPTGTTGLADGINKRLAGPHNAPATVPPAQAAKQRAALIRQWIAIGIHLHRLGDYAGWVAICAALCSRAVARLEATWRYVADKDRELIGQTWAPRLAKLGWAEGIRGRIDALLADSEDTDPRVRRGRQSSIPYFGDACVAIRRLPAAPPGSGQLIVAENLDAAERVFGLVFDNQQRDAALSALVNTGLATDSPEFAPITEYQATLQALAGARTDTDVARYLNHSLHAEPKTLGAHEPYWRQPRSARATTNAMVPLLFPQPLPHLSLVDRAGLLAGVTEPSRPSAALLDPERTITARSPGHRPALSGSPLSRSLTFPTSQPARNTRTFAFNRIPEWSSLSGNAAGNGDEHVLNIGPDLVLRTVGEVAPSAPSSPRASKRFSQDMSRQTRPLSQVSKRSSLPASNRNSVVDAAATLEVTLKAGSLEKITDIMVMGVDHITTSLPDDNGEVPLSSSRKAHLSMDLHSFRLAFLGTFRTLCTPNVMLRMLVKRFVSAEAAGAEYAMPIPTWKEPFFPTWQPPSVAAHADHPIDWDMVTTIRAGVLATLQTWFERFAQDFAEDRDLYEEINAFFAHTPQTLTAAGASASVSNGRATPDESTESPIAVSASKIAEQLAVVEQVFRLRVMTPNTVNVLSDEQSPSALTDLLALGPSSVEIDIDTVSPGDLVNYLECIAASFFYKVYERDLLVTAELFEMQASSLLGWFPNKQQTGRSAGDGQEPWSLSLYKLLEVLVQASEMGEQVSLLQRLPPAVRDVLAVHQLIKGWLAIHIIEIKIGVQKRQERLERMLDAVWICRARMVRARAGSQTTIDAQSPLKDSTVASFVESALVGALTTPESRLFVRAWQGVAMARHASGEYIKDLIPAVSTVSSLEGASVHPSIPDLGWVLQSLAEAASRDFPETETAAQLINFDKQRLVWNLVQSSLRSRLFLVDSSLTEMASLRLRNVQATLCNAVWDPRLFKEDAAHEAGLSSPAIIPQLKGRPLRPLNGLSLDEQAKSRRQRQALETLTALKNNNSATRPQSPQVQYRASTPLLSVTPSSSLPTTSQGQMQAEKKTRRMTAIFRGAVRLTEKPERVEVPNRSLNELMGLTPLQKASYSAGCGGAQVAVWHNSQRSFVFHLTSQEGAKYLLQAPTAVDLSDWVGRIETSSKLFARSKVGESKATRSVFTPLWGPSIIELAEKEGREVPLGLERMLMEIEARGLREQGIYRISGAKSAIMALKEAFNKQAPESVELAQGDFSDVHTIAGAVKQWFRDLPNPPVPFSHYDALIEVESIKDTDARMHALRDLIWDLPKAHFDVLRRIIEHLARVVEEGQHNKMFQHNIGLVFATSLLNPPPAPDSLTRSFANVGKAAHIVSIIVTGHEWLFEAEPDPEPELEPEPEAEAELETETGAVAASEDPLDGDEAGVEEGEDTELLDDVARTSADLDHDGEEVESMDDEADQSKDSLQIHLPPLNFTPAASDSSHGLVAIVTGVQADEDAPASESPVSPASLSQNPNGRSATLDLLGTSPSGTIRPSSSTSNLNTGLQLLSSDHNKSSEALAADIEEMLDAGLQRLPSPQAESSVTEPSVATMSTAESEVELVNDEANEAKQARSNARARNGSSTAPVSRRRVGAKEESVYLDATDALEALDFAALAAPSSPLGYHVVTVNPNRRPSEVKMDDIAQAASASTGSASATGRPEGVSTAESASPVGGGNAAEKVATKEAQEPASSALAQTDTSAETIPATA